MNAELEYAMMQNHAQELRQAAARHRRAREAMKAHRSGRRSVLGRILGA
ncbi:MAG: hypothetical protein HOY71_31955 [Nonomuraea sp.]|nr:hypothetical protein [Nonomuraea sp.]